MSALPAPLPILPSDLLRRYGCAEPNDTRFRAAARLRQSLWREQQGYACGRYVDAEGRSRRLGSRVTDRVGRTGINLVDPPLIPLVQREIACREVGAFIHVELSVQTLVTSTQLRAHLNSRLAARAVLVRGRRQRLSFGMDMMV